MNDFGASPGTTSRKDIAQATAWMDYLLTHDTEEIATIWGDVNSRGPGWSKRLKQGFASMNEAYAGREFAVRMAGATG